MLKTFRARIENPDVASARIAVAYAAFDAASSAERTLRTADWRGTNQFPGQLLLSETDEDGLAVTYTYDSLKRLKSRSLLGRSSISRMFLIFSRM